MFKIRSYIVNVNFMAGEKAISWEELSADERDLFANPHQRVPSAMFSVKGFGLQDTAFSVIAKLNESGKREALATLDEATAALDQYGRPYPRHEVDQIRSNLRRSLN
ncbi:MAG: hypothetical protein V1760_01335 [Candidatus Peregrinibacteria bacterium]